MKEINLDNLKNESFSGIKTKKTEQKSNFKRNLKMGILYHHPLIYDFAIWLNDPTHLIPKTIVKSIEGNSILDLGCGSGALLSYIPKNYMYTGLDLNKKFLSFAQKKGRGQFFCRDILGDLSNFKADTVILSDILHHVTPNQQMLLDNALGCAQKKIIISDCYEKEESFFKRISEYIGRRIIDNDGFNIKRAEMGWLKINELLKFLQANGASNFQKVLSHIHCEIVI